MKTYDVVIVGGAIVGSTLALALSQQSDKPLSIAIVESSHLEPSMQGGFDARSIALSVGTTDILNRFGLWQDIKPLGTPITDIHVSDQGHFGSTEINATDTGVPALGYVVELAAVGALFYQRLNQQANIDLLCPCSVTGMTQQDDHVEIVLSDGNTIHSKLVVAADGTHSLCSELVGMESDFEDYGQVAIIANVLPERHHNGQAFERFTSEGPVALLPMSEGRMSLVWCVHPDKSEALLALNENDFLTALQQKFGWRLGRLIQSGCRHAYPLGLTVRKSKISHRLAGVGNAAQTLHPIAGQGFNLGIRDIASLVDEVMQNPEDPGEYRVLHRYKIRRENDQQQTINLTSSLVHLFSNQWLTTTMGRNIGLMVADNVPLLKRPLLHRTLGKIPR